MKSVEFIVNKLEELSFETVLEVGSGAGYLTEEILDCFDIDEYVSCDQDVDICKLLQDQLFGSHLNLANYGVKFENMNIGTKRFDLVIASHVLEAESCKEPIKVLDKMLESTKKYIVHTGTTESNFKEYWSDKLIDWNVIGYRMDSHRVLFVAEKIIS